MSRSLTKQISETLGLYRAEYLSDRVYDFMEKPAYWDQLEDTRPVFVVGGRGTGKTTALLSLTYQGQARFHGDDIENWSTLGFYWRVDSPSVAAFRGSRLAEEDWVRLFSHYVNLQFTSAVLGFVRWAQRRIPDLDFSAVDCRSVGISLGLSRTGTLDEFETALESAVIVFESAVNGPPSRATNHSMSMLGRPFQLLLQALEAVPLLRGKQFAFCIDEYENLEAYQQRVINTLIKHVGDANYTFKVGMRELGLHERATLNPSEFLTAPADFVRIGVEESLKAQGFGAFAERICNGRLGTIEGPTPVRLSVRDLLPEMSVEEEALELGVLERTRELRSRLLKEATPDEVQCFDQMSPLAQYLVEYWAESQSVPEIATLRDAIANLPGWQTRLQNYSYAMLFTIRRRVRGHAKFYAGWSTFVQLADGNIRYLLYIVTEALSRHSESGMGFERGVAADVQTSAAKYVGERIVFELGGLHDRGTQLTRLVLGLGRVFGVMARSPQGHAPEVTQVRIEGATNQGELDAILSAAVMHSALVRFPGDKRASGSAETRDFDYQMHPIFAPFFEYSFRRKRRMNLQAADLLGLAGLDSRRTIDRILRRSRRDLDSQLPPQLELFSDFYVDANG